MKQDQLLGRMPLPAPRSARVLAGAVAIVFLLPAPLYVLTGWDGGSGASAPLHVVVPLTAALALLHLRHARAALQEKRPQGWVWSLGGLLLCVYAPLPVWGFNWASAQTFVIATAMLLLRGPLRWILAALPLVVMGVYVVDEMVALDGHWVTIPLFWFYWWSGLVLGGASLWGSVRLVRVLDELMAAREALAQAAVDRERLRLSRDLHDLLGQSLSAVSLKGDLALALLQRDPAAAQDEVRSLTAVARSALHDIRDVVQDERRPDLARELAGASALLTAAGVQVQVYDERPAGPDSPAAPLLAWVVREAVTNVLRHSDATHCTIALLQSAGTVVLRVVNDGARFGDGDGDGSGLRGLRERAGQHGGQVRSSCAGERFELEVRVPLPDRVPA